ncbi:MAG TPA: acyltransferase [Nevskiales bacterium]|nr:acyltransferase [Nevskiales bacterium]
MMAANRIAELDALRGLALLMVLFFHCVFHLGLGHVRAPSLFDWTWTGLDIFLVLSGYLITRILLAAAPGPGYFLNFFLRRALRIFPAYYAALLLIFGLFPLLSPAFAASATRDSIWIFATYIQNWVFAWYGWPDWHALAHLWSMAVEEQFYLAWPFVVLAAGRERMKLLCLAIVGLAAGGKLLLFWLDGFSLSIYTSTLLRMDGIAAGAWLACYRPEDLRSQRGWLWLAGLVGIGLMLAVIVLRRGPGSVEYVLGSIGMVLASTALVGMTHAGVLPARVRGLLCRRLLVWYGVRSYSIYLLHYPVQAVIWERIGPATIEAFQQAPLVVGLLVVLASVTVFTLAGLPLYYLVERPCMQLRVNVSWTHDRVSMEVWHASRPAAAAVLEK